MRKRAIQVVALALGIILVQNASFAAPAPAKDELPPGAIPANAPIVVQMHGYQQSKEHLTAFLSNSLPDIAPKLASKMDEALKELLEGRDAKSFSKDGHIFLILTEFEDLTTNPHAAVWVPVSSYANFRDSFLTAEERKSIKKEKEGYYSVKFEKLEEPVYIVDRKSAVAITKDTSVAKTFAAADYESLEGSMGKEIAKTFLDSDIAVYVNLKQINEKYGAQIKQFKTIIEFALANGGQGIKKEQIEVIKEMIGGMTQALEDGKALVMSFNFGESGASMELQAEFGEKTDTNTFLKKFKPSALAGLATLPTGQIIYSASQFNIQDSKLFSKIAGEMIADDQESEEAKKAIQEAITELSELRGGVKLSVSNLFKGGMEIQEFPDASKMVAAELKLMKALAKTSTFGGTPLSEKPVVKEASETVGDFKLNSVFLKFDLEKAVAELPENAKEASKAMLTKMLGDGLKFWFGSDGKRFVQVTAKDFSEAKSLLQEYLEGKKTLAQDDRYVETRKHLPKDATMLIVGDTCRTIEGVIDLGKEMMQGIPGVPGGAIPAIKAPKTKPAYFGMAITAKSEYATFKLFVPTVAVQQVRKMFSSIGNDD